MSLFEQVARHVLARHDPSRCAESSKRSKQNQNAVRFRGNELLGMVAVGGLEVRRNYDCRLVGLSAALDKIPLSVIDLAVIWW